MFWSRCVIAVPVVAIVVVQASSAVAQDCDPASLYGPGEGYSINGEPRGVAIGDLDGDGQPDVFAVGDPFRAAVLLNDGAGRFVLSSTPPGGNRPDDVELVDIDGDGDLDAIATSLGGQSLGFYRNRGDGTFEAPISIPNARSPRDLDIGDIDGDGDVDVVVANFVDATITVLINLGGGVFAPPKAIPVPRGPLAICLGDFDRDGTLDIAAADTDAFILPGLGGGLFGAPVVYGILRGVGVIQAVDLNDDGWADLAATEVNGVAVLLNAGDGTLLREIRFEAGFPGRGLAVTDANGDGTADLVTSDREGVSVFLNDGTGSFDLPARVYGSLRNPARMAAADLDRNGLDEVVVADFGDFSVFVFESLCVPCPADLDGDGELTLFDFLAFQNLFDAGDPAADFDGDGRLTLFDFLAFQNAFDAGCP